MTVVFHLLGFHMHQPPGNLRLLIDSNEWESRQIRIPKLYAESKVARDLMNELA